VPTLCSVVIPVYGNEASLGELVAELEALHRDLDRPLEVVFVVDASPDDSLRVLETRLPHATFSSQLLVHARNFGSFAAIRSGLMVAKGQLVGVMAADLQEPASLMREFFSTLEVGHDVVYGARTGRHDPALSSLSSRVFWAVYRRFVLPELPEGGVDIFGVTRRARDVLLSLAERNSSLVAQLFWIGFSRAAVPYARRRRPYGRSAWTLAKKLRYLADSLYGFSDLPIRALSSLGAGAMALSVLAATVVLIGRLTGHVRVEGYTPVILSIVFFGGLNAFGLGVIGQYVWRAFENTKARPLSIIGLHTEWPGAGAAPATAASPPPAAADPSPPPPPPSASPRAG
jgi:polyisoprenyl-phosphate glycosyltransferase